MTLCMNWLRRKLVVQLDEQIVFEQLQKNGRGNLEYFACKRYLEMI